MSSGRFLGGLLIGGGIGAVIGLLLAPRKGEETRAMIREEFADRLNSSVDTVRHQTVELRDKARDTALHLRDRGQALADDLEETGRETWDKVRSSVKSNQSEELPQQ